MKACNGPQGMKHRLNPEIRQESVVSAHRIAKNVSSSSITDEYSNVRFAPFSQNSQAELKMSPASVLGLKLQKSVEDAYELFRKTASLQVKTETLEEFLEKLASKQRSLRKLV
ncbi:Hypothetical_protein [Hexamita inflata]|uniref:Hypothetical_protein n=1 Tax=Hexamita inflata TaxID=28002 RepID=A0AA86UPI7_9EUKA|nr:Hypothetical protein HINF_LOCUS33955 [Hexamita inflata]CAI9946318.1 Hypothetical protein HINF_LOCUS33963 [Hexamita inflata]